MTEAFAAFGNLSIDDLVFIDGTTKWAIPGGNAMYSALGMAVWGERPSIVAPIGPDYPLGTLIERVDVSRSPSVPRNLRNWGLYEEDGSRHFIFRYATRNWADFSPKPETVATGRQTAAHIDPLPWTVGMSLIEALRVAGTPVISIDLDDRDLAEVGLERTVDMLREVDLFLPSRQDALALFPGIEPGEALRRFRDLAPDVALIAIKCGAAGIVAHGAGESELFRVPAVPVDVVDATGAGDSFCGGALVGFVQTADPIEAMLAGAVSASFAVETLGLTGLATATSTEAQARLDALRERVTHEPI